MLVIKAGMDQPRRVQKFELFWKMSSGVKLGSTVDTRSRVSLEPGIARFVRAGRRRIPRSFLESPEECSLWTFLKDDFKNISTPFVSDSYLVGACLAWEVHVVGFFWR